ncbi:MAG: DUF4249 domain-containing protein, partial [Bacteroidales bacterium]|nr:DUF4249 domain-containing protein [Bacteroidales bacterium]
MKRIIYILITIALLASCEKEFDATKYFSGSKTILTFVPSNDYDTTFVSVQATTPLNEGNTPVKTVTESIAAKVNGQDIVLTSYGKPKGDFGPDIYYTTVKFNPGDKIEVEATLSGHESVSGNCVVPNRFPNYTVDKRVEIDPDKYEALCFDISYDNDLGNTGFYGVGVVRETHRINYDGIQEDEEETVWGAPYDTCYYNADRIVFADEGLITSQIQEPMVVSPDRMNYSFRPLQYDELYTRVLTWTDVPEKGGKGKHQVRTNNSTNYVSQYMTLKTSYVDEDGIEHTETHYRKSETMYRYKLV